MTLIFPGSVPSQLPPVAAARSTITDPAFIVEIISLVISLGAGFPGIVLKIVFPNLKITLVDSLNKRINFLNDVIEELNLKDIKAVHSRIEDYSFQHTEEYDVVTARAVAPINILLELGVRLVKVGKYFVAMKGNIENEPNYLNCIDKLDLNETDKIIFSLPIENSTRTLIKFEKKCSTNRLFPRKYSDIKKRPL